MWKAQLIRDVLKTGCMLVEEPGNGEKKKERVKKLGMDIWEKIDPTPNLDFDDWIVERILDWAVDWIVEDMNEFTESLNLS